MEKSVELLLEQLDIHTQQNEWFVSMDVALEGITSIEAAWRFNQNNTIWQIVNHLIFCNNDVIHRLNGTLNPKQAENNEETFGEPGSPEDETGWEQTLAELHGVMQRLRDVIARMDDGTLDLPYRENSVSTRRLLSNIMMHDTYHIGQIVLMRKLQSSWNSYNWA